VTTYGVIDVGGDVGEVVQRQLDVLAARYPDQPRTAARPVPGVASSRRRQVAASAGH